jgi:hypothetical protein
MLKSCQEIKASAIQSDSSPPIGGTREAETSLLLPVFSGLLSKFARNTQCHMTYGQNLVPSAWLGKFTK